MAGRVYCGRRYRTAILSRGGTHYYWSYTYKHLREAFQEAAKYRKNKIYYTLIASLEEDVMTANPPKPLQDNLKLILTVLQHLLHYLKIRSKIKSSYSVRVARAAFLELNMPKL
jgi:hypothetical protein